jgi:hypothetical protein
MHLYYRLLSRLPVPCTIHEWSEWLVSSERHVAETQVGPLWISTVFLGLDHSLSLNSRDDDHMPILFETMIFGDEEDRYQTRCCTWDEAEAMHVKAVDVANGLVAAGDACVARIRDLLEDHGNHGQGSPGQ